MSAPAEEPAIRPCKGTCGRMTRPRGSQRHTPSGGARGTVVRLDGKYCGACYSRIGDAAVKRREAQNQQRVLDRKVRQAAAFKAREDFEAARARRQEAARQREVAEQARRNGFRAARRLVSA